MTSDVTHQRTSPLRTWMVFALAWLVGLSVVWSFSVYRSRIKRKEAGKIALHYTTTLRVQLERSISSVHLLASMVYQGKGKVPSFEKVASRFRPMYTGVTSMELQKNGIITQVVPRKGNEKALGKNLLTDPSYGPIARAIAAQRDLVLSDPLTLYQGDMGLVARMPIYLANAEGKETFWGFVASTVAFQEVFKAIGLRELKQRNYHYLLAFQPKDDKALVKLAASGKLTTAHAVHAKVSFFKKQFCLYLYPKRGWYDIFSTLGSVLLALLVAALLAAFYQANLNIRQTSFALAQAHAESAQLNARFRALMEAAPDAFVLVDGQGKIALVNAQTEYMFDYERKALVGRSIDDLLIGDIDLDSPSLSGKEKRSTPDIFHNDTALMTTSTGFELLAMRRDGSTFPVEICINPIANKDSGERMTCGSIRDITERRQIQQQLREAKEAADTANRAKSSFLATMSHEIRTPMNAIINMTKLALESELSDKQRQYIATIDSSSRILLDLINDILDFSKIEADRMTIEQINFHLRHLIEDLTHAFRGRVLAGQVEFITFVEDDTPDELLGDPLRIRQVLNNLIGNAFKFTEKGEVLLNVRVLQDHPPAPGGKMGTTLLRISIRDTGVGIAPEKQGRLFQSFSQADSSTARKYGGTGLGLAISQRLVHLMGGQISLESAEGMGTTFHIDLPFTYRHIEYQTLSLPAPLLRKRVLQVEDNDTSRDVVERTLENFGLQCVSVPTAEEAWALLNKHNIDKHEAPFHVLLIDWILPGMDGLTLAGKIREHDKLKELPIVLLSCFAGPEEEQQAQSINIQVSLAKPLTATSLYEALLQATGHEKRQKQSTVQQSMDFRGSHLLMAEDNESNQFVAQEILERWGVTLDIANDGREAVEMALQQSYDLILMDMQMPKMDGLEATRQIRQLHPNPLLPIIALTANVTSSDIEACKQAGMNDFVGKPIQQQQLHSMLSSWLAHSNKVLFDSKELPTEHQIQSPPKVALLSSLTDSQVGAANTPLDQPPPEMHGVDLEAAQKQLGLPLASLYTMLQRFARSQPQTVRDLDEALQVQDREAARRHAHSLAGAAGNLSIKELYTQAKVLEHALKGEQDLAQCQKLYTQLAEEATAVFESIQVALPDENESSPSQELPSLKQDDPNILLKSRNLLLDLIQNLEDYDINAMNEQLSELTRENLPMIHSHQRRRLQRLIEDFDYTEALSLAQEMLETVLQG